MFKKMICVLVVFALVAGFAFAQEEKKPEPPKVAMEFSQRMDSEQVNGWIVPSTTYGTDALYSRTEFKAGVTYKLGGNVTITPSFKDRLEVRLNPGNLIPVGWTGGAAVQNAAVEKLGKIRERNRFYANLDSSIKIIPLVNVAIGFEARLAADLRSDKAGPSTNDTTGQVAQETKITGSLGLNGKDKDKDELFSYSLFQALNIYADTVANGTDELYTELDGSYGAGVKFKLGEVGLKLDVSDALTLTNPTAPNAATDKATVFNGLSVKATMTHANVSPFLGFFLNTTIDKAGTTTANVAGGSIGLGMSSGAWSFAGQYDLGYNSVNSNMLETHATMSVKIKS